MCVQSREPIGVGERGGSSGHLFCSSTCSRSVECEANMAIALAGTLVVVGSSNTDLVVRVREIPRAGETVLGGDVQRVAGGKGANQAVAAARLGARVVFVGCVGDDSFGEETRGMLARDGLLLDHLRVVAGVPSGMALIA